MDIIGLPACNDTTANSLFWTGMISLVAGAALYGQLTKLRVFAIVANAFAGALVVAIASIGLWFVFWMNFNGVSVDGNVVRLHYLWPRSPQEIDASTIRGVGSNTDLQSYTPGRWWKHQLQISTRDGQEYKSVYVCIDRKKVGPDYQSAIHAKLNDPIEQAEQSVAYATVKSIMASPDCKTIDPSTYAQLFVTQLRRARGEAMARGANPADRRRGFARLDEFLAMTQHAFGETSYPPAIVYDFIGSAYGHNGDLKAAKKYFDLASRIRMNTRDAKWYSVDDRIYKDGMSMFYFEHPEGPKESMSALSY